MYKHGIWEGKGVIFSFQRVLIKGAPHCSYLSPPADLILMQWKNTLAGYCATPTVLCKNLTNFLKKNRDFMQKSIDLHAKLDMYWYQVQLFLAQLEGLVEGYNTVSLDTLTLEDLL